MRHKLLLLLGLVIPIFLFLPSRPAITGSNLLFAQSGRDKSDKCGLILGSESYVREIGKYSFKYGNRAALSKIMDDVDRYESQIDANSYVDNLRLYRLVSYFVGEMGYVDSKVHYFRNKLNRAPATLNQLLLENERLPQSRRWKLLSVKGSLYHLQGPGGIYNLKFVSADSFCEAVYDRNGSLLTEKNDPVNMGTFNYSAGIRQQNAHRKYDVLPYLMWGNDPGSPQKGYEAIRYGVNAAAALYERYITDVTIYRSKVISSMPRKV